jgi:hypothetical protein
MSNLSSKQFSNMTLYRGIHGSQVKEPLGMHWSEEPGISTLRERREPLGASRFLGGEHGEDLNDSNLRRLQEGERGTIIHGNPQNEATKWTRRDKDLLESRGVISAMSEDEGNYQDEELKQKEAEVPLRPGKKVKVTGLTRVRSTKEGVKTRQIKFNPARVKTI